MYIPSQEDLPPCLNVGFSPVQKWSGFKTSTASVAAWMLSFDEPLGNNPLAVAGDSSLAFECNAYTEQRGCAQCFGGLSMPIKCLGHGLLNILNDGR
jgi:hypothetical protein